MANENIISVTGIINDTIYSKGDTCLLLNPFETYHLFRVYNNWDRDDRSTLNLQDGGQRLYLVFKSRKTEVRIPEFTNTGANYVADKMNGEVIFKITKEQATTILSMSNNVFYITRVFENRDKNGNIINTSGEEVIYTGNWADENKWVGSSLSSQITALKERIDGLEAHIDGLTKTINEQTLKIETLTDENNILNEKIKTFEDENEDLKSQLSSYNNANEFTSVVISDKATYSYYKDDMEVDEKGNPLKKELLESKTSESTSSPTTREKKVLTEDELKKKLENSTLNVMGTTIKKTNLKI